MSELLKGHLGFKGKSAYEIWLEEGHEGTKADFLESLTDNSLVKLEKEERQIAHNNLQNQINVERARINNFTQLDEGSTTGDAELTDIRVGCDGIVYNSAGEAVRKQVASFGELIEEQTFIILNNLVTPVTEQNGINLFIGYLDKTTGQYIENESFITTDFISVNTNTKKILYTGVLNYGSSADVAFYDVNKNLISINNSTSGTYTDVEIIPPSEAKYYRCSFYAPYQQNNIEEIKEIRIVNSSLSKNIYDPQHKATDIFKYIDNELDVFYTDGIITILNNITTNNITTQDGIELSNGYINKNDGEFIENTSIRTTGFIPISENTKKVIYTGCLNWSVMTNIAFYDKNYDFISAHITDNVGDNQYTDVEANIPEIAKYYRASFYAAHQSNRIETLKEVRRVLKGMNSEIYDPQHKATDIFKFVSDLVKTYTGKKWVCIGDSLTANNSATTKHYYDYIQDELGINVVNMGVGGTGYMRGYENNNAFYQRVLNCPTDADFVTIFGSGNDLSLYSDLGDYDDSGTDTICGCINTTLDNFFSICSTTPIGIIAPTPWQTNPTTNVNSHMNTYVEKLKQICDYRGIPFLDLYHSSNLRPEDETNRKLCFYNKVELDGNGDGVHPNELGHKIIATKIREFIKCLC